MNALTQWNPLHKSNLLVFLRPRCEHLDAGLNIRRTTKMRAELLDQPLFPTGFTRNHAWCLLFLVVLLGSFVAFEAEAGKLDPRYCERIVDAIWHIEGGRKARSPYGILSVPVRGQVAARRVCLNTVQNTWERWQSEGRPGDFLDYLASRYVPASVDPVGNRNWRRNIRARLNAR